MSKQIARLVAKHPDKIESVSYEGSDGIWLHLKPGWRYDDEHTVHEWSVTEIMAAFNAVKTCSCPNCVKGT